VVTERDAVDWYLERVVAEIGAVFADRVVGVWVLGPLAYGGFGPTSDIDVQAAVRDPTVREIAALVERISHPRLPCPAEGLEFVLYDVEVLESPTPPLRWALNLNGGPVREHKVSTDPTEESWHWFVLDLAIGRETARTMYGQDLRDIVGPIGREHQLAAIAESLRWHDRSDEGDPNRIANAARGLRFLRTGQWVSKPEGLQWAESVGYSTQDVVAELAAAVGDAEGGCPP
jgi:hypothetical protein